MSVSKTRILCFALGWHNWKYAKHARFCPMCSRFQAIPEGYERNVKRKKEIKLMLIPLVGVYWVFENIIDAWKEKYVSAIFVVILFIYQISCWIGWKYLLDHLTTKGILPIQL